MSDQAETWISLYRVKKWTISRRYLQTTKRLIMGDYEKLPTDFMLENAPEDDSLWELLSVYADGEATPAEAAQIESLLRSDSALKREFDFMRLASSFVAAEPEIAPPAELRDRIFAATVARPTLRRQLARAWADFAASLTPRYALAGGLAGIALLTFALRPHNNNQADAPQIAKVTQAETKQVAAVAPPVTSAKTANEPTIMEKVKVAATTPSLKDAEKTLPKSPVTMAEGKNMAKSAASLKPKTTLATNRVKSAAPKHPAMVKAPQTPSPVETNEPIIADASYSRKPDMDRNNQRPASVANAPDSAAPPDDRTAETSAPTKPVTVALADAPRKPQRYEGHIISPPDNARQMTPSFMRQQIQAHNAGYGDLAISSIRHNQIRLGTELRF